jgi:hypothetical protein
MMGLILMFIAGIGSGVFFGQRIDEYKEAKLQMLEQLIELEEAQENYFFEDSMGQIWMVSPGYCQQIF